MSRPLLGSLAFQSVFTGAFSPKTKRLESEADYKPTCNAEIKKVSLYLHLPCDFMAYTEISLRLLRHYTVIFIIELLCVSCGLGTGILCTIFFKFALPKFNEVLNVGVE